MNINTVESMINLVISSFRKYFNNFVTKSVIIYWITYDFMIRKSYNFSIIIIIFFSRSFNKYSNIYILTNIAYL